MGKEYKKKKEKNWNICGEQCVRKTGVCVTVSHTCIISHYPCHYLFYIVFLHSQVLCCIIFHWRMYWSIYIRRRETYSKRCMPKYSCGWQPMNMTDRRCIFPICSHAWWYVCSMENRKIYIRLASNVHQHIFRNLFESDIVLGFSHLRENDSFRVDAKLISW